VTLLIASLSALSEMDAKKIVALSTLSQLGIMFLSISLGNAILCLFHVITHALAKANLFLRVGNILHIRQSQQDSRWLSSKGLSWRIVFPILVRVRRLRGLIFLGGYFSKEQILIKTSRGLNSLLLIVILLGVARITLSYCLKLTYNIVFNKKRSNTIKFETLIIIPLLILRGLSIIRGLFLVFRLIPSISLEKVSRRGLI